jgi:hypothetical protein
MVATALRITDDAHDNRVAIGSRNYERLLVMQSVTFRELPGNRSLAPPLVGQTA